MEETTADPVPFTIDENDIAQRDKSAAIAFYDRDSVGSASALPAFLVSMLAIYPIVAANHGEMGWNLLFSLVALLVGSYLLCWAVAHRFEKRRLARLPADVQFTHAQFVRELDALERANACVAALRRVLDIEGEKRGDDTLAELRYVTHIHANAVAGFKIARRHLDDLLRPERLAAARKEYAVAEREQKQLRDQHHLQTGDLP